ncbi:DUF11 domain-containing protein [Sphingomonas gilva]|uniref:DUF11 domain-containing protein n=1 Tax=Sphingomonas gilva TaxID=2305907 RepID=A0A396RJJ9_9SPHN|nr:DUF11 domain-containing protein [Sphingomonas gilva]RHW16334.1 DUF11 domain-containing protein [Sphingomonas gilva]
MMKRLVFALAALLSPALAHAANDVALTSAVFVEKTVLANGQQKIVLEEPSLVVPGDKLVFVLNYRNRGATPATDFVVTNPMPGAVAFQSSPDQAAVVSIDGGRSWGTLSSLKVKESDGTVRGARPEDVTHVRWTFAKAIPAGQGGKLSFRGVVR